jgi:hypothetical protein
MFSEEKVSDILERNHHSMKQNRITTQNAICRQLWSGIFGSVLTLPGQALPRTLFLYYLATHGFRHTLSLYERDRLTFSEMEKRFKDVCKSSCHFVNLENVVLKEDDLSTVAAHTMEDLDFCAYPSVATANLVLSRLNNQMSKIEGPKGFSYTVYEVNRLGNGQRDAMVIINRVVRALGATPIISADDLAFTNLGNLPNAGSVQINTSSQKGSFCRMYHKPFTTNNVGCRLENGVWFRFRESTGDILNTFAVRYT